MSGHIFVNPHSGSDTTSLEELRERFVGHVVEQCPPEDLAERIRKAVGDSVDFIGVAGGDGTVRCGADELGGTGIPLLVVPGGTRNHFAKDLGIPDLDSAVAAARAGREREVDVACVNGRSFVNNSSVGTYPELVRRRERHERRVPKRIASIVAAFGQLRHARRLRCDIDGDPYVVWMVFVGNGRYGDTAFDVATRDELDDGRLDVRIVRGAPHFARLRLFLDVLLGRLGRSRLVEQRMTSALRLSTGTTVDVAVDGEVETVPCPLEYTILPRALRVLVPE